MNSWNHLVRRIMAAVLCLSLLLASAVSMGETTANVTDTEGPKVTYFKFAQNGKTLKAGDKINVSLRATDRSGIDYVSVSFDFNETGAYAIWFDLKYDAESDLYTGEYTLKDTLDSGLYILSEIYATDQFGNTKNIWSYNSKGSLGKFTFKGTTVKKLDATAKIDQNGKNVKLKDKITVTVNVKSKLTDLDHIDVMMERIIDDITSFTFTISCFSAGSGNYVGEFTFDRVFPEGIAAGKYSMVEAVAYAKSTNPGYPEDFVKLARMDITGQSITLKDGYKDTTGPKISSGKIKQKGKTLKAGKTVHVEVTVKDDSKIQVVEAALVMNGDSNYYNEKKDITSVTWHQENSFSLKKKSGNVWQGDYTLPKDMANGKYFLEIRALDQYDNDSSMTFEKQYITFKDDDYVTDGISSFLKTIYNGITDNDPTDAQINDLGMKLAKGTITGVEAVKSVLDGANLSAADQVSVLYDTMKGSAPEANELSDWTAKLEAGTSVKNLIDKLAESKNFRTLCNECKIKAGSFGTGAEGVEIGATAVTKIKLNEKKYTLRLSGSKKIKKVQLKATVTPKDATDTSVTWTSSDPSVAKVNSKGKVTAVSAGTCTITCTANDGSGKSATCKITVKKK